MQAVVLGMEGKARERELVSSLLAALCPACLAPQHTAGGFTRLLSSAEVPPWGLFMLTNTTDTMPSLSCWRVQAGRQ